MKKLFSIWLLTLLAFTSYSQVAENCYRLFLTDKNYSSYSLNNPEAFLSTKAIDRRVKQNIEIKQNDLPVSKFYTDSLSKLGLQILNKSKWLNSVVVYTEDKALIDTITNLTFIKTKQKVNKSLEAFSLRTSNVKAGLTFSERKDEPLDYGYATTQISMINGHILHRNGYKGQGMTIAVIDAGFYKVNELPAFDSLWAHNKIIGTKDFVDHDTMVFDASNHGMKVLSTMGGNVPGQLIGTAPEASYWLLRSEQTASEFSIEEDNWVAAAEFADSVGCNIITSSLGYTEFDDTSQNYSYSDMDGNTTVITRAADVAASKGILVINSAGNMGDKDWRYISAPGDGDSVLTVGAVDAFAQYAYFSGLGPTYDGRIKPNIAAMGYQTIVEGTNGSVTMANGTSFSTPIIAGMSACLWQSLPDLSNMEIFKRIEESAHQYSNPDFMLGYGIPDFARAANLMSTNILEFADEVVVKVYPNPFVDFIHVELRHKTNQEISIELFNILGRKMAETSDNSTGYKIITLNNLNYLTPGIYILQIKIGSTVIRKRISKF